MDLRAIQTEAWDCAESKGQHNNLRNGMPLDVRAHVLIELGILHAKLACVTQEVKRHGVSDANREEIVTLLDTMSDAVSDFTYRIEDDTMEQRYTHVTRQSQAIIRLALVGTEVAEAIDSAIEHDGTDDATQHLADELADGIIRYADLAEESGIDLDAAVQRKLAYNRTRAYGYGTPLAQQEPQA